MLGMLPHVCMSVYVFECMYVCMGILVIWNVAMPFYTDDRRRGGERMAGIVLLVV